MFKYFKGVAQTKLPVEVDTFSRIMQPYDYATPHKSSRVYPVVTPENYDRDLILLQVWFKVGYKVSFSSIFLGQTRWGTISNI